MPSFLDDHAPGPDPETSPYREVFEAHPHPLWVFDIETLRFLLVNEAAVEHLGYPRDELLGMTLRDIRPPEDIPALEEAVGRARPGLRIVRGSWRHRTRDGQVVPVEITSRSLTFHGRPARLVQSQDISERVAQEEERAHDLDREREARQEAEAAEARFRAAFDGAVAAIVVADPDVGIRYANPAFLRLVGHTWEEIQEMDPWSLVHPDDREANQAGIRELTEGRRESFSMEKRYLLRGRRTVWVRDSITALRDEDGEVTSILAMMEDLTRFRAATRDLDLSNRLLALAGRLARLGGWRVDLGEATVYWSDEVCEIHEEPPGTRVPVERGMDYYVPEHREIVQRHFKACVEEGVPYDLELQIRTALGKRVWVRTVGEPVFDERGDVEAVQGAFQDITREREARAALELEKERFRAVARATADVVYDYDLQTGSIWWSEGSEEVFGFTADEMGSELASWRARVHPGDREEASRAGEDALGSNQSMVALEYRFQRKDGSYAVVQDRASILRDPQGRPLRMVGGLRDITESRRMQEHLFRSQRLESIGTLAGGIAHDLNNVLAPIVLSLELLRDEVETEGARELLATVEASARRGTELVRQVLGFARGVEGVRSPVFLQEVLDEVCRIIRETFPKDITLRLRVPDDLPPVFAEPTQIHQVLLNLCLNARDALPHGGLLEIQVEQVEIEDELPGAGPAFRPGSHLRIRVRDEGIGMPRSVLERATEPFFTTKEVGKGTGLGLSTAEAIVRSHGGHLLLESTEGAGSTVEVHLPLAPHGPQRPGPVATVPETLRGRGELVLVVDDEPAVRRITGRTLEIHGYRTLLASDGAEALVRFRDEAGEVDLVLTDMTMPIMDGTALIEALRRIDPDVRVVAVSGREAPPGHEGESVGGPVRFLSKPYSSESLLRAIRQELGAP